MMLKSATICVLFLILISAVCHADVNKGVFGKIGGFVSNAFNKVKNALTPSQATVDTISTAVGELGSCTLSKDKGWYDQELGNFTIDDNSPYCDSNCTRSAICCSPEKPQDIEVKFLFFDERNQSYLLNLTDKESANLLKKSEKIVWFAHGFKDNIRENPVFNQTKDAFVARGFDVVLIDWSRANRLYFQALANIRIVGALTGQMMEHFDVVDKSMCVGFSLGSHVCGEVGSWTKKRHQLIPKCIGVDPAGPGFDGCSNTVRLDKDDCHLVVSIHTSQFEGISSIISNEGLGTKKKTGHCDFWANQGKDQPKCNSTLLGKSCSHARGMDYFVEQVEKNCNFIGYEADCGGGENCSLPFDFSSYRTPVDGKYDKDDNGLLTMMPIPPDDLCTTDYDKDFRFLTKQDPPYC